MFKALRAILNEKYILFSCFYDLSLKIRVFGSQNVTTTPMTSVMNLIILDIMLTNNVARYNSIFRVLNQEKEQKRAKMVVFDDFCI